MGYYIDLSKITLEEFQRMLESTYLLPSQQIIAADINERFQVLKSHGINNMQQLQQALKSKNDVNSFSRQTSLPVDYLTVLRRVVKSYHPQARKIRDFAVLSRENIDRLEHMGIKTTLQLYDKVAAKADRNVLKKELDINDDEALLLTKLVDVSRLRYVNPAFATLLLNSDYDTVIKIKNADYQELHEQLVRLNKDRRFYKGRINLKDMKFLVNDTDYILLDIEY